jgi:hypothetical protein
MEPVSSNNQSKTCPDILSSSCITWSGNPIPGTCGVTNITQVISAINASVQEVADCCKGTFPLGHQSCYTGSWVNFSSGIVASGSSPTCSWTVNTGITAYGPAQYKWTKEGDLKIRGGFRLIVTPTYSVGSATVPMGTLSTTCFPTGATDSQFNITAVDPLSSSPNSSVILSGGVGINVLTGALFFGFSFSNILLTTMTCDISLGGTTFNLA